MDQTGSTDGSGRETARRTLVVIAIVAVALLLWQIADALLLIFIGVLPAILLRGLAKRLSALVPLPLGWSLGIVAFAFVGVLAAAAILLALTLGLAQALYAALVYFIVQQIEGNLVTPLIQQREVSLPPVLVLFAVVAAGLVFGLLGIIVATPLVVVIMGFVKMLYAEDMLGKNVSVPGAA